MMLSEKVLLECVKFGNVYDSRLDIRSKIDTMMSELTKLFFLCVNNLTSRGLLLEAIEFSDYYFYTIELAKIRTNQATVDRLHEAIAEFTPPGMWFRSHPDRDWDIGFWPCDWFEE